MQKNNRIGIDIRLWSHPCIGRYIRELVGQMNALKPLRSIHLLGYAEDLKKTSALFNQREVSSKIYSLGEQWEMTAKSKDLALLHTPHFNIPVMRPGKLVATIHDLIYLHDAKSSKSRLGKPYAQFLFKKIEEKASAILTVSEYTKNDLLNHFPNISSEKVFVTHEAVSPFFKKMTDGQELEIARRKFSFLKPFVLFVGSLKDHKNIPALIEAVRSVRLEKKIEVELVVVGRRDMKNKRLWELIIKNREFVKYLGELPDEDLLKIYNLAQVFVLPSLREGFGLPVLEAMACGTPVIVSNRTSLPEIAGGAGLVFDANRVDELASLLYTVWTDASLRESLSVKGLARASEFSWKKTADKTLQVYEKVL